MASNINFYPVGNQFSLTAKSSLPASPNAESAIAGDSVLLTGPASTNRRPLQPVTQRIPEPGSRDRQEPRPDPPALEPRPTLPRVPTVLVDLGDDGRIQSLQEVQVPAPDLQRAAPMQAIGLRELYATDPARADRVLEQYYSDYARSFPDPDEVEPSSTMKGYLQDPKDNWNLTVLTDGQNVLGGFHTRILDTAGGPYGMIEHLWIGEDHRRAGRGSEAVRDAVACMREANPRIKGVLGEINDPHLMTREQVDTDAINPNDRFAFWGKQGARMLDAPYIQAPLDEGANAVKYLGLFMLPTGEGGESIPRDTYLSMCESYFSTFKAQKGTEIRASETYQEIAAATPELVRFIPLEQTRSFIAPTV